ncbi:MAG: hypothetical protein Q9M28_08960 [Mariprofundaceae bacterium]|nr:hypothetical protein [Mariprofundaceae bacterium]
MSDELEFLRSLYEWRDIHADQLDSFEEELRPLCGKHITDTTLHGKYEGKLHLGILNLTLFSHALNILESTNKFSWALKDSSQTHQQYIDVLYQHDGRIAQKKCTKDERLAMEVLLKRGIVFLHRKHYCLPLEFLIRSKGAAQAQTWLHMCKNMKLDLLKTILPVHILKTMRPSPVASELATQFYLLGIKQRAIFKEKQLDEYAWSFLFDLNALEKGFDGESLSHALNLEIRNHHVSVSDVMTSSKHEMLNHLFQMGLIGISLQTSPYSYTQTTEHLIISDEAQKKLKPYWQKQKKRIIHMLNAKLVVKAPKEYQHSVWENDHPLWRMWVTLHFLPTTLTQQDSWRVSDIKKISKVLGDFDQDAIYQLINTVIMLMGSVQQQKVTLDVVTTKSIQENMQMYLFRHSNIQENSKEAQQAINILKQLPEDQWLDISTLFTLLDVMGRGKSPIEWTAFFKSYPRSPFHFSEEDHAVCLLPHFKTWLQGKEAQLTSPGWRGLHQKAKTTGYISAAGDIQLPPETSAHLYPQLASFCHLVSVEHMVNLSLDPKAIKALSLKPKELANAKATLESIQSPLPQAVNYLFERERNQKVIAKVTPSSALIEVKDPSALNQLSKIGNLSACPGKKNAWLLNPSDSAASFIEKCRKQGLKVEGDQAKDDDSTSSAWIEGFYSVRAWINDFNPDPEGIWLEIVYQKRKADALKTCYAYYVEFDYWNQYIKFQLVKSRRNGYTLAERTTKFEHQHLHKVRILSDSEVKALNIKDS